MAPPALAATATYAVLLDTDANPATGCTVTTVKGPFAGVEQMLTTTVTTTASGATVSGVTQQVCAGGSFGAPASVDAGGWPVGFGNGSGGTAAVETYIPLALLGNASSLRLAVVSAGGGGADAIVAGADGLAPEVVLVPAAALLPAAPIPALQSALLALLALLVAVSALRAARGRGLAGLLLSAGLAALGAGVVWAATVILDGQIADWAGVAPLATDAGGNAPPDADLVAVFAQSDATRLYFRIDADVVADIPPPVNQPPVVNAGPDQALALPSTATLAGAAIDDGLPGSPGGLTYAWTQVGGPLPAVLGTPGEAGTIVQFPQAGAYAFRLSAFDGELSGTDDINVTVATEPNLPPQFAPLPDRTITVGDPFTIRLRADDPNAGDTLQFFLDGGPAGAGFTPVATPLIAWTPTAAQLGPRRFDVRVRDTGGLQATASFTITVVANNRPPAFAAQPDASIPAGGRFTRALAATDPDGDPLTFALLGGPGGMTLAGAQLAWLTGQGDLGEHLVTVRVDDPNGGSATARFAVRVVPGARPVARDDRYKVVQGNALSIAAPGVLANDADPDGGALTALKLTDPDKGSLTSFNADGSFTYQAPPTLPPRPPFAPALSRHADVGEFSYAMAIGDVDGDGVADIVHLAYNNKIRALKGVDGSVLWALDGFPAPYQTCTPFLGDNNLPVIADVDDDGNAEVVFHIGCGSDYINNGGYRGHARVMALDGATGAVKWRSPPLVNFVPPASPTVIIEAATLSVARLAAGERPSILGGIAVEDFAVSNGCASLPGGVAADKRCRYVFALDGGDGSIRRTYYSTAADQTLPAFGYDQPGSNGTGRFEAPLVLDLEGDGALDVVFEGTVWSAQGTLLRQFDGTRAVPNSARVAAADLDGDGKIDLVYVDHRLGRARAVNPAGGLLWDVPAPMCAATAFCAVSIADVDADGTPEVLIAGGDRLFVLDRYGALKWAKQYDPTVPQLANPLGCDNRPAVYDLDGDGVPEVMLRFEYSVLFLKGTTGEEQARFRFGADTTVYGCNLPMEVRIADVDGDGRADVVFAAFFDGVTAPNPGGIWVLKSANDPWMPARALFNQWGYTVTAIADDLTVPPAYVSHVATPANNHFGQQTQLATRPDLRTRTQATFTYAASANAVNSAPATVTIDIEPPNRPPAITSLPPTAAARTNFAYQLTATDPDAGDTLTWSLVHADVLAFDVAPVLNPASGLLTKASAQEGPRLFIVRVTDSQGAYAEQAFIVNFTSTNVPVPAVIGQAQDAALAALAGARLVGGRVTTQYDAAAAGLVIGQSPGAAASVPAGTTVALVVSRGPQPKLVPNVAGRPLSAAGPALTPSGFSVGAVSYVYSMQVARGDIVSQSPAAGLEVVPGPVDVVVSGGTGLAVRLSPEAVTAGNPVGVAVVATAPDGTPVAVPPVTLAVAVVGVAYGAPPQLSGMTVTTAATTRGTFEVTATETGGAGRVAKERFTVLNESLAADPTQQSYFAELAGALVTMGELAEALDRARIANDAAQMRALLGQIVAAWRNTVKVELLSRSAPLAPSGGFPPQLADLPPAGLNPTADDALVEPAMEAIADQLAAVRDALLEGPASVAAYRARMAELEPLVSAFTRVDPTPYGMLAANRAYAVVLARRLPATLDLWLATVAESLPALSAAPGDPRALKLALPITLAEVSAASSIHVLLAKKLYMPAIKHVGYSAAALALHRLLRPYANSGTLGGIVTGASLSFHVFNAPYSTIEMNGVDPRHPENNSVLIIGPSAITSVLDLSNEIKGLFDVIGKTGDALKTAKNLDDLKKQVEKVRDTLGKAIDQGFKSYNAFNPANFQADLSYKGCILSQDNACASLAYKRGLEPVHTCGPGELCLPAPVLFFVWNTVDGGADVDSFVFLPAPPP
ncbi:MAG: PASTA domain-containing protein [Betaproteobacteria bacterium]|nr:PASTA domain-containing protein [Betaproteobacteria bacterium]